MENGKDAKLGSFLKEVSNWHWDEFCQAEHDHSYSSNQAIIFGLIRSCVNQKLEAIKVSINRLDGKLKTPIKIELPKVFYIYPNAKLEAPAASPKLADPEPAESPPSEPVSGEVLPARLEQDETEPEMDLPSMSLRQTLTKMADYPRSLPDNVLMLATATEAAVNGKGPLPREIPMVKSVVAASLLTMAQKRNIDALREVFDQIDGKLAETIQILGDDIYITIYSPTAPPGAYLNDDGVLQLEAEEAQNLWAQKLDDKAQA